MWSVQMFWDHTSAELGAGTGRGVLVRVVVRREALSSGRVDGAVLVLVLVGAIECAVVAMVWFMAEVVSSVVLVTGVRAEGDIVPVGVRSMAVGMICMYSTERFDCRVCICSICILSSNCESQTGGMHIIRRKIRHRFLI